MPQPEGHLPQVVKKKEGHMPELRKRRTGLALLGAFAMVASVLAVGASPVSAVAGKADATAAYSACVGPAAVDAGFTDVATGSTHDAAINCIAYYGITRGTTATTFAPNRTISRWQLAVMLQRAAGPAGVELADAPATSSLTDIGALGSSFQSAIGQIVASNIMSGTTATTFDPDGIVSRAVIVEALAQFMTKAGIGPGGKALSLAANGTYSIRASTAVNAAVTPIDETFRDIGGVNFSANQAIRALAEMGVVAGRGDGTFAPTASVTRAQAASFITRALAHTNTRPAGLTMQVANTTVESSSAFDLAISLRDADFAPMDSASIDVFQNTVKQAATAFNADGTCNTQAATGVDPVDGGGSAACQIELADEVTEPNGNLMMLVAGITEPTTFWAWSSDDTGDKLDWDDDELSRDNSVASNAASVTLQVAKSAGAAKVSLSVSRDAEGGNTVRYGTTVVVTIQLVDGQGQPVGIAGHSYQWSASGVHNPTGSDRIIPSIGSRVITTDARGRASFTITQSDPDTVRGAPAPGSSDNETADDSTTWTYQITAVGNATALVDNTVAADGFALTGGRGALVFEDDPSTAHNVGLELQRTWTQISGTGTFRVGLTGKVTDQYGSPLGGVNLFFDTSGEGTFGCTVTATEDCSSFTPTVVLVSSSNPPIINSINGDNTTKRTTRSNGVNRITASATNQTQAWRVIYQVAADLDASGTIEATEIDSKVHAWTQGPVGYVSATGAATPSSTVSRVLQVDMENNVIVKRADAGWDNGTAPNAYSYDDSTLFRWFQNNGSNEPSALGERWLRGADEFERRFREYMKNYAADWATWQRPGILRDSHVGFDMTIQSYNDKTGPTVYTIILPAAAPSGGGTASLYDPPAG